MTQLLPRLAVGAVAGVGLYFATLGLPLPTACATPSPSCGGDLRECLRQSADMRETTFGGRYVTAEDVSRCMEAFSACIHGGASSGGAAAPPSSTTAGSDGRKGLPERFGFNIQGISSDCRRQGQAIDCTTRWESPPDWLDSYTGTFTGSLSGLTATGTTTTHLEGHSPADSSCTYFEDYSGPATFTFNPDGTVSGRAGPNQRQTTNTGSCPGSNSGMTPGPNEVSGSWKAIG